MTARILSLFVGLVLVLQPLSGLSISQAALPDQFANPPFATALEEPVLDIEEPGVFVEASSTVVKQRAGFLPDEPAFAPDACTLPAPDLISPVGGAQVGTLVPDFQWSRTGDEYRVQISTTSDFSVLIYYADWDLAGEPNPSVDLGFNLSPNTTYHWRVASVCSDATPGAFSSAASFGTGNVAGPFPDPPSMTAPSDGASGLSLKVTFSWGDVPGATAWQVRIYPSLTKAQSDDQWHTIPWWAVWSSDWDNSTLWTFRSAGTYYWRVGARTDLGWGPLSPVWSFTVGHKVYLPVVLRGE